MRNENVSIDLSTLSLIRAYGADTKTFLDGQLTNDLDLITPDRSQLSAWCTAQGRMLVVFRIFLRDGSYYLQLPATLRDETLKRLRMFVLRSKVVLETTDDALLKLGVVGPDAETLVRNALGIAPDTDDTVVVSDTATVLRLPGIHPRFEVIAPPSQMAAIRHTVESRAKPTSADVWAWHDIMAGIPSVLPQTREEFVPQMANLELVGGVNFKKGCYPGQEIVARMQYLGRLKQRMYRSHSMETPVTPGTKLYVIGDQNAAGMVMDAQSSPDGGSDMLIVVRIDAAQSADLHIGDQNGPRVSIEPLPYAVDAPPQQSAS